VSKTTHKLTTPGEAEVEAFRRDGAVQKLGFLQ
jgi:hypothetical protein